MALYLIIHLYSFEIMTNPITLKAGSLLISEPFMPDPNFKRSVVLLTEHGDEGTVGYILNQKSNLLVKDVIPDCWAADFPIYLGGPVASDTLHYVHAAGEHRLGGDLITNEMYWGGNFETLKLLINQSVLQTHQIKFFVGYSGWEPGQLEDEIAQKSWIIVNNYQKRIVFEHEVDELWKQVVLTLGPKFAHLAFFPEDPMWN